jgi:aldehyde:ferredoxin oxidoreductase
MAGYSGEILRINLTTSQITTISTADYEGWGGGHGIGTALFWDLIPDKTLTDGFDPANVVTIMSSPLAGTLVPAAGGRTEVQGIGTDAYPTCWFTRSNFGGRFSPMLKYAGWDGIVIEGKASSPVWIDIRDYSVQILDAGSLWGKDTWQTQTEIWDFVSPGSGPGGPGFGARSAPAVLTIGAAGENQTRMGSLIHDAGNGAGQGGFGGVWGSKNLKAISVLGTGAVQVADPNGLMEARLWSKDYGWDPNNPVPPMWMLSAFGGMTGSAIYGTPDIPRRSQGCLSCHRACRSRRQGANGNESSCFDMGMYNAYDQMAHGGAMTEVTFQGADLSQKYGINNVAVHGALVWLHNLHSQGIAGPGLEIDTDLPFEELGELSFLEEFIERIVNRQEIGQYLAEGNARAAEALGRLEQDLATGTLPLQYWGTRITTTRELKWIGATVRSWAAETPINMISTGRATGCLR